MIRNSTPVISLKKKREIFLDELWIAELAISCSRIWVFKNFSPPSAHFFAPYFPFTLISLLVQSSYQTVQSSFSAFDALRCYCLFINRLRTGLFPNERKIPSRNRDFPGNVYLAAMFVKWRDRISSSQLFSRWFLSLFLSLQVRKKRGTIVTTVNFPHIHIRRIPLPWYRF